MAHRVEADMAVLIPVADTYIHNNASSANFGTSAGLKLGTTGTTGGTAIQRGLVRFDLSSALPPGSSVLSVQLRVEVVRAPGSTAVPNFRLFRVLSAWGETEASWDNRLLDTPWSAPGGAAGTDYASTASASIPLMGFGDYTYTSTDALVADVQSWVDNPATNNGWMIISDQEGVAFTARKIDSREGSSPPSLQIDFLPPPVLEAFTLSDQSINFQFTAEANFSYQVQFADSVDQQTWQVLTNQTAQVSTFEVPISDSITNGPQRFYRLLRSGPITLGPRR